MAERPDRISIVPMVLTATMVMLWFGAMLYRAFYFPEYGYDESPSHLALSLLDGHYGHRIEPLSPNGWSRYFFMDVYPPVYFLFGAGATTVLGFGLVQMRLVSLLFVTGTTVLCYLAGRRHAGGWAGLGAVGIWLWINLQVAPIIVARPDPAVVFFVLSSALVLVEACARRRAVWFGAAGVLYALATLSHFVGLLAGPFFAGALLWHFRLRVFRDRRFFAYLAGFFVPWLAYAAFAGRYLAVVWIQLSNARLANVDQTLGSVLGRWPLRPTVQHLKLLNAYYPWVFLVAGIATLGLVPWLVPGLRRRLTLAPFQAFACAAFLALFVLLGTYPNIVTYPNYAPLYLVFAAPAVALTLALPFAGRRWSRMVVAVVSVALAVTVAVQLAQRVRADVAKTDHRPLAAYSAWTQGFHRAGRTVLGYPSRVFSSIGADILTPAVYLEKDGSLEARPELVEHVPGFPRFAEIDEILEDQYMSHYLSYGVLVSAMGRYNSAADDVNVAMEVDFNIGYMGMGRSAYGAFQVERMLRDGVSPTGNVARLTRVESAEDLLEWPEAALADADGLHALHRAPDCIVSVAVDRELESRAITAGGTDETIYVREIPFPGEGFTPGQPLAIRIVLDPPSRPGGAYLGAVLHFASEADRGYNLGRLLGGGVPFVSAAGAAAALGPAMPAGEYGRVLMVQVPEAGRSSSLVVIGDAPARLRRIDLAWLHGDGDPCIPAHRETLERLGERLLGDAAPHLVALPSTAYRGETIRIELSQAVDSVDMVVWLDGSIHQTLSFCDTRTIEVTFERTGLHGIELYLGPSGTPDRPLLGGFIEVAEAPSTSPTPDSTTNFPPQEQQ